MAALTLLQDNRRGHPYLRSIGIVMVLLCMPYEAIDRYIHPVDPTHQVKPRSYSYDPRATPPPSSQSNVLRIAANEYSQFWADVTFEGDGGKETVRGVIDSGATGLTLPRPIALRIGLRNLKFTSPRFTANGRILNAETQLKSVSLGGSPFKDFPVEVNGGQLDVPLIGAALLRKFDIVIFGGVMT